MERDSAGAALSRGSFAAFADGFRPRLAFKVTTRSVVIGRASASTIPTDPRSVMPSGGRAFDHRDFPAESRLATMEE